MHSFCCKFQYIVIGQSTKLSCDERFFLFLFGVDKRDNIENQLFFKR